MTIKLYNWAAFGIFETRGAKSHALSRRQTKGFDAMSCLSYVNVKQGSASSMRFSHGNTLPLTQLPWGMAGFIPQTEVRDKNWYFHPGDRSLEGVRLTHQPSFHLPWLFAVLGRQDKTAYWVKRLAMEAFSWKADGFPGDEDNGTTAAWYVFAVLGIYPVCPGKPEFVKGKPLVGKIWLCGKELHIEGDGFICIDEIRMN